MQVLLEPMCIAKGSVTDQTLYIWEWCGLRKRQSHAQQTGAVSPHSSHTFYLTVRSSSHNF